MEIKYWIYFSLVFLGERVCVWEWINWNEIEYIFQYLVLNTRYWKKYYISKVDMLSTTLCGTSYDLFTQL